MGPRELGYSRFMFVIALTGGLGAGKSTAARFFAEQGAVVINLDAVAAKLLLPGTPLLDEVADEFGRDRVLTEDGSLDRRALAEAAFASAEKTARLNTLVHPAVAVEARRVLGHLSAACDPPRVVIVEIPLLAEAPQLAELAREVLAIEAPQESRVIRAVGKGMRADDAQRRIGVQAHDADRARLADHVITNDGDIVEFRRRLGAYWDERVAPRLGGS